MGQVSVKEVLFEHRRQAWHDGTMVLAPLTPEEFASLAEIARGLLSATKIPPEHLTKLLERGFIVRKTLEYFLTDAGETQLRQRLQETRKRGN